MKNIIKANYGFIFKSPGKVSGKSNFIGSQLTKYPELFESLSPKIADGLIIINALGSAIKKKDGTKAASLAIKTACINVQGLMRNWGPQVTIIANGNPLVIFKSGFDNYKQREATPDVYTPAAITVKDTTNSGKVKIRVPAVPHSNKYQYRYCTKKNAAEADMIILEPGKRVLVVNHLTPVTVYYFSCRVFGKNGSISDWNECISYIVR